MTISPNIHERKKYRFTYTYLMRGSFEKYANAGNNSYKYTHSPMGTESC